MTKLTPETLHQKLARYSAEAEQLKRRDAALRACQSIPTVALEAGVVDELREALRGLTEVAEEMLIKGGDEICQLPMCGEAKGHVGWCPILLAQECLAKAQP